MSDRNIPPCIENLARDIEHGGDRAVDRVKHTLLAFRDHCVAEAVARVREESPKLPPGDWDNDKVRAFNEWCVRQTMPKPPAAAAPCVDGHATGVARVDRSAAMERLRKAVDAWNGDCEGETCGARGCGVVAKLGFKVTEAAEAVLALPAPPAAPATASGDAAGALWELHDWLRTRWSPGIPNHDIGAVDTKIKEMLAALGGAQEKSQ